MKVALRHHLGDFAVAGIGALLFTLPWLRSLLVERSYGAAADCSGCVRWASLGNDAWLAGGGVGLLALGMALNIRSLRTLTAILALILALTMLLDTMLLDVLGMRLYMLDVLKFGGEGRAATDFFSSLLQGGYRPAVLALLTVTAILVFLPFPSTRSRRAATLTGGLALVMILGGLGMGRLAQGYVHSEGVVNLAQLQGMRGANVAYSPAFAHQILASPRPAATVCEAGQGRRPDVILVIVESLSAYHSALLGGADLVPELDGIARQNTWFQAFHANGFTTDHGLIALLDGRVPVPAVGRYLSMHAFEGFGDPEHSAYGVLRRFDYQTTFFTTGNLGFLDKAKWLRSLQVEHFEGSESPYYKGMPRGVFDAPNDAALYGRFLQWLDAEQDQSRQFFAALLTVETHPPFFDKRTGKLDEEGVFRRADVALGEFYRELTHRRFFEHGILLVTGDHRSMTAVSPDEWLRFGSSTLARVPLVVAGASGLPKGAINSAFQQTDFVPSLAQLAQDGQVCREPGHGAFLRPDPQPPAYVLHARGDRRGRVDVYYPVGEAWIELNGDASTMGGAYPERTTQIATAIHRDRIERGELSQDMPERLLDMQRQRLLQSSGADE